MAADPESTSSVNERLGGDVYRARNLIWTIIIGQGVLLVTLAVVAGLLGYQQLTERPRVDGDVTAIVSSQCEFYAPLTAVALDAKSSKAVVQLVEGAREAVHGLGCPGRIPPPSRELLMLGQKWGVKITY